MADLEPAGLWAEKSPAEIVADLNGMVGHLLTRPDPDSLVVHPEVYIEFIRATVPNLYERLKLLWNLGCRGRDLR